jgi:hypothetical protein
MPILIYYVRAGILYRAYFQSLVKCGIIFWLTDGVKKLFVIKKNVMCLILGIKDVHPAAIVLRHIKF